MSLVNGLCISVLTDAYHFSLTSSPSADVPPSTIETSIPFALMAPESFDSTIRLLKSTLADLNPCSQTVFCLPFRITTVHLRTLMSIIKQLGFPSLKTEPIGYRQAYSAALPATDPPASILFLQCSPEESESELIEFEVDGKSTVREIECDCLSVRHPTGEDLSAAAQKLMLALVNPLVDPAPARIVILGPPSALAEAVRGALSTVYPSIPIHLASFADLSSGAAKFLLPDPDAYPRTRRTAMYIMPLPVSIATADGGAVVAVPDNRKIRPVEESILLTTSVDNQTSATVRIFLGDHARADDNLACGSVVLKGLNPMQRGEALVRVTFVIAYAAGATVTVEQVIDGESGPGPSKIAQFPDLIRYLGTDYERYAVGRGQHPAVFVEDSAGPVGELPA